MIGKCAARIAANAYLTDAQGNPINLQAIQTLTLNELSTEDITLPPTTYFLAVPFPVGVTTALFAWIYAEQISDLTVATVYNNQSSLQVPQGMSLVLYNLTGLWVSSVLGGMIHMAIGG